MSIDPFFIFYDSRSGSTFLARLLAERSGAVIPPEANFLPRLFKIKWSWLPAFRRSQFLQALEADEKFGDWEVEPRELMRRMKAERAGTPREMMAALIGIMLERGGAGRTELGRFGFKKGNYQYHVPEILELFPRSRYICLIRDGRGVFASKKRSIYSKTGEPFETDAARAGGEWVRCARNFEALLRKYPDQTKLLRYEDLIEDSEQVVAEAGAFLGLEVKQGAAVRSGEGGAEMETGGSYAAGERYGELHANIHREPLAGQIGAWREELTAEEIALYNRAAGEQLKRYGYDV